MGERLRERLHHRQDVEDARRPRRHPRRQVTLAGPLQRGLTVTVADPAARRARIARRTARGDDALARITEAVTAVERVLREELGPRRYGAMTRAMRAVGDDPLR